MKFSKLCLTLTSAALLAACGGGDESALAPRNPAPVVPPVTAPQAVLASTIVTSVPAPTYAADSEELVAFNVLNAQRAHCGFGLLAQDTKIDVAAKNHASYLILNHLQGHYQASGDLGFTGVTPADRVLSAG
ncbi:MAG: CAP domain-containing protein, partial [Rhodoferax sp.]